MTTETKDFVVYGEGPFYASVCSSLPQEEVEQRMHARDAGTQNGWQLSKDKKFASGGPNPTPCDQNPETHTHYLFEC